jgi:hypothetical protein
MLSFTQQMDLGQENALFFLFGLQLFEMLMRSL